MKKYLFLFVFIFTSAVYSIEDKKVALLFLTRSDLNQTEVWKEWVDETRYTIYNHSKTPTSDPWFSQFRIADIQPNEWGYTLLAQQALLKEALKDPSNYKFVFLSESCVPLRPNDQVHQILCSYHQSHMRWYDIWWKGNPHRTLSEFPSKHHFGNHTWIILNRKHAQMIADDTYWIHLAMRHLCCDEAYPSTFFSMRGVLHEFKNELTTYVDWFRGPPYTFTSHTEENFNALMDAKYNPNGHFGPRRCLFARKFSKDFPPDVINSILSN